jgi:hypothetical protein
VKNKSVLRTMNVLLEALIVGLILVPVYWVVEKLLPGYSKWVVVFVAGAGFHLAAEVTGLNAAYIATKR